VVQTIVSVQFFHDRFSVNTNVVGEMCMYIALLFCGTLLKDSLHTHTHIYIYTHTQVDVEVVVYTFIKM